MEVPLNKPDLMRLGSTLNRLDMSRFEEHAGKVLVPSISRVEINEAKVATTVTGIFEEERKDLTIVPSGFKAEKGQVYEFIDNEKHRILIGLGKESDWNVEEVRKFGANAIRAAEKAKAEKINLEVPNLLKTKITPEVFVEEVAFGAILSAYRFSCKLGVSENKKPTAVSHLNIVCEASDISKQKLNDAVRAALVKGGCQNISRYLSDMPSNALTPLTYPVLLELIAHRFNLQFLQIGAEQLLDMNLEGVYGVGKGSKYPGSLILLGSEIGDVDIVNVIIGKGITYDTGGYSIKTSEGMLGMHRDMEGSAGAALALVAAHQLGVKNALAIAVIAENRINSESLLNDSIMRIGNRNVRILNTDAEGRLVLADGVTVAAELLRSSEKPVGSIATLATLTGAACMALGNGMRSAAFTTDAKLRKSLESAAESSGELIQFFDIEHPSILEAMQDYIADLRNSAKTGRYGGHITAARFLHEFSFYPDGDKETKVPFLHIDMAPVMDGTSDPRFRGAHLSSGWGVQILNRYLMELAKQQ